MLCHRLRRWHNIKTTFAQSFMFVGSLWWAERFSPPVLMSDFLPAIWVGDWEGLVVRVRDAKWGTAGEVGVGERRRQDRQKARVREGEGSAGHKKPLRAPFRLSARSPRPSLIVWITSCSGANPDARSFRTLDNPCKFYEALTWFLPNLSETLSSISWPGAGPGAWEAAPGPRHRSRAPPPAPGCASLSLPPVSSFPAWINHVMRPNVVCRKSKSSNEAAEIIRGTCTGVWRRFTKPCYYRKLWCFIENNYSTSCSSHQQKYHSSSTKNDWLKYDK